MCGCDCNGCGGIPFCTGNLFVIAERIVSYLALTAVVCCIVILFAVSIGMGIGLGYNYCVVDMKVQSHTSKPTLREGSENLDETRRQLAIPNTNAAMDGTRQLTTEVAIAADTYTLTLPLNANNMDFTSLLAKLRSRNKNITLELLT